jgi:sulfur carrier protein
MLTVVLNGQTHQLPDGATLLDAVRAAGGSADGRGVAAAVDGEVVPRGEWESRPLTADERVEVLQAVQGG